MGQCGRKLCRNGREAATPLEAGLVPCFCLPCSCLEAESTKITHLGLTFRQPCVSEGEQTFGFAQE